MQSLNDLIDLAQPVFDCVGFFCVKNTYACEGINDKKNYFLLCVAMMMSVRACRATYHLTDFSETLPV